MYTRRYPFIQELRDINEVLVYTDGTPTDILGILTILNMLSDIPQDTIDKHF